LIKTCPPWGVRFAKISGWVTKATKTTPWKPKEVNLTTLEKWDWPKIFLSP